MLPELNKFYVDKELSVLKCVHVVEEKNNQFYRHMFVDSRDTVNYAVKKEEFEKNFHELIFNCETDDPTVYDNYRNYQFITELFDLVIDKSSNYNITYDSSVKLNPSKDFEYVDLSYDDHKYIVKGNKDIAIVENIRENKTKTLYKKIIALQNSGLLK